MNELIVWSVIIGCSFGLVGLIVGAILDIRFHKTMMKIHEDNYILLLKTQSNILPYLTGKSGHFMSISSPSIYNLFS